MNVQAQVFPVLVALHNYILEKDPTKITDMLPPSGDDITNRIEDSGQLAMEYPRWVDKDGAKIRHDQIAERMWDD